MQRYTLTRMIVQNWEAQLHFLYRQANFDDLTSYNPLTYRASESAIVFRRPRCDSSGQVECIQEAIFCPALGQNASQPACMLACLWRARFDSILAADRRRQELSASDDNCVTAVYDVCRVCLHAACLQRNDMSAGRTIAPDTVLESRHCCICCDNIVVVSCLPNNNTRLL